MTSPTHYPLADGELSCHAPVRAYLMTGPWELSPDGTPGIWMDDPDGGDPHCLCLIKRIYRPDDLRDALSAGCHVRCEDARDAARSEVSGG